jgi:hypothetical protein
MKTLLAFFVLPFGIVSLPVLAQPSSASADPVARVEAKVTTHLQSYFMTRGALGIPSSARPEYVTVDIDTTTPVQGWTRRYLTIGTATVVTKSVHAPNYACHFEVIAEIDEHDVVRIVDTRSERVHE